VRPKASWAGLICRTCLHLKHQILPHNCFLIQLRL